MPHTRLLLPSDLTAWQVLWQQYLDFYQTNLDATTTAHTWERLMNPATSDMVGIGVVQEEQLLGFAHLVFHPNTWSSKPCCYLEDLCVDSAWRGQGLGRRLIETVIEVAQERQCCRVYWVTHRDNTVAQQLYNQVAEQTPFVQYKCVL